MLQLFLQVMHEYEYTFSDNVDEPNEKISHENPHASTASSQKQYRNKSVSASESFG